jgi:hypothetical protein
MLCPNSECGPQRVNPLFWLDCRKQEFGDYSNFSG